MSGTEIRDPRKERHSTGERPNKQKKREKRKGKQENKTRRKTEKQER